MKKWDLKFDVPFIKNSRDIDSIDEILEKDEEFESNWNCHPDCYFAKDIDTASSLRLFVCLKCYEHVTDSYRLYCETCVNNGGHNDHNKYMKKVKQDKR